MTQTITAPAKSTNRGQLVDNNHVDALISNYKKNRWLDNSKKIGKPDSLSTWYGLTELQGFLNLAKENNADGIKMYFGEYAGDFQQIPEFQNRQTVVLVATRKSKTAQGIINKEIYTSRNGKLEILAFNLGDICPPWCGNGIPPDGDSIFGLEMSKTGISIIDNGDGLIIV